LGCVTGRWPEFGIRIGILGRQHDKKSEESWGVIMALLEKTLLDELKFLVLYIILIQNYNLNYSVTLTRYRPTP